MFKRQPPFLKLALPLGLIVTSAFLILAAAAAYTAYRQMNRGIRRDGAAKIRETTIRLDRTLSSAMTGAVQLAGILETRAFTKPELEQLLLRQARLLNKTDSRIAGINVAFRPYGLEKDEEFNSLFAGWMDGMLAVTQNGSANANYFSSDWYAKPKEQRKGMWIDPFNTGRGINLWMFAYAVPFYRLEEGKRQFCGVVTVDLELDRIRGELSNTNLDGAGFTTLLTSFGWIISHPDKSLELSTSIFNLADSKVSLAEREEIMEHLALPSGQKTFPNLPFFKGGTLLFHTKLVNDWTIALALPANQLWRQYGAYCWMAFGLWGGLLALTLTGIGLICRLTTRPLEELAHAADAIGRGELQTPLPKLFRKSGEIGRLTTAFVTMQERLRQHADALAQNNSDQEKIVSEISVARTIQRDILPILLSPLPDYDDLSVAAMLRPAMQVSGDTYDVMFLDPDHLLLTIGDVSGHGVPAALFMAIAQTLQRGIANTTLSPAEITTRLNGILTKNNNATMFMTSWLGILEISSGKLTYCNAGHNRPLLRRGENVMEFGDLHGPPLAVIDSTYGESTFRLNASDVLVLYTDGVTEAFNKSGEMYGLEHFSRALRRAGRASTMRDLVDRLIRELDRFTEQSEQADDITMLVVEYRRAPGA